MYAGIWLGSEPCGRMHISAGIARLCKLGLWASYATLLECAWGWVGVGRGGWVRVAGLGCGWVGRGGWVAYGSALKPAKWLGMDMHGHAGTRISERQLHQAISERNAFIATSKRKAKR